MMVAVMVCFAFLGCWGRIQVLRVGGDGALYRLSVSLDGQTPFSERLVSTFTVRHIARSFPARGDVVKTRTRGRRVARGKTEVEFNGGCLFGHITRDQAGADAPLLLRL